MSREDTCLNNLTKNGFVVLFGPRAFFDQMIDQPSLAYLEERNPRTQLGALYQLDDLRDINERLRYEWEVPIWAARRTGLNSFIINEYTGEPDGFTFKQNIGDGLQRDYYDHDGLRSGGTGGYEFILNRRIAYRVQACFRRWRWI